MKDETARRLRRVLYGFRRKYYGVENARDLRRELKGNELLSRQSFRLARKLRAMPNNHAVVREIFAWSERQSEEHPILAFGSVVYGPDPHLRVMEPRRLDLPFRDLIEKVSCAAAPYKRRRVHLVFDQRFGADNSIAIGIQNFLSGMRVANIYPFPLFGVSHVMPGLQIADIVSHILGRRAVGDQRIMPWWRHLLKLQWKGKVREYDRWGFQRYNALADGTFRIRRQWR